MLSKEEIEEAKECLQETIQNTYAEGKAIKLNNLSEYIEQLEDCKEYSNKERKRLEEEIIRLDTQLDAYKELAGRHIKEIEQLENKIKELEATKAMQEYRINEMDIPKQVIENKIEKYKLLELESFNRDSIQADEYRAIIKVLQELLEGK